MSEIGQVYRTMAQDAVKMHHPCIRITPAYTNDVDDWARLIYMISETIKKISDATGIPIHSDIADKNNIECESSSNGKHEMMEFTNDMVVEPILLCIHCGKWLNKTIKTGEQLKEHFKEKQFDRFKIMPRSDEDNLQF